MSKLSIIGGRFMHHKQALSHLLDSRIRPVLQKNRKNNSLKLIHFFWLWSVLLGSNSKTHLILLSWFFASRSEGSRSCYSYKVCFSPLWITVPTQEILCYLLSCSLLCSVQQSMSFCQKMFGHRKNRRCSGCRKGLISESMPWTNLSRARLGQIFPCLL